MSGAGCEHAQKTGFDSVTCLCPFADIPACQGQTPPQSIQRRMVRSCRLFVDAAASGSPRRARGKLLKAIRELGKARRSAARAGRSSKVSKDCAMALVDRLGDARERARRVAASP